ncbi:MAG: 4-hydroxythreonine-4-phosphate dehydrogenase PdxA [Bacteroidetes bacterium]|nr:4-hydroxythreonine-4-phosphate dehydrogenase PdxA [Bacteroidota bacterium]
METTETKIHDNHLKIGITHGDINGIGYEVIIKALGDNRILDFFIPVIYGQSKVASFHKKNVNVGEFNFNLIKDAGQAHPKRINIVNCTENDLKIDLGQSTEIAGQASLMALEMAVSDLKSGKIDALVTAPINKQNIQSERFHFPGHTEFLANQFGQAEPLMIMVWENLRVATLTGHIPLKNVAEKVSGKGILSKLEILNHSLKQDFGITRPKIAILGLNPHAGDGGLLGTEETDIIIPAMEKAKAAGILSFGPFPADGFFGAGSWKKYDAVLSMYHDQGLTAFKSLAFDGGVNYTAGLSIVRTSPAHGTAYSLAGKDVASAEPFRQALYLALELVKKRFEYTQLTANQLKSTVHQTTNE